MVENNSSITKPRETDFIDASNRCSVIGGSCDFEC